MSEEVQLAGEPSEADALRLELDATKRKLVEADKMILLGRLLAGVVHEINTPIGSIFSNNEVIIRSLDTVTRLLTAAQESGSPPPKKVLEMLETMRSLASVDKLACERISSVIRSLKTYARADDGDLRKANIHDILNNVLKLSSCEYRRRVTVETDYGDVPEVECYPQTLGQVFLNLLVNAGQAIEDRGTIKVRTRAVDGNVIVEISDTGRGIAPEHRARIFTPGFTTKPIGEGTGLGLTITREIVVDGHGGTIDFESEIGVGTTFRVTLPLQQVRKSKRSVSG